MTSTAVRPSAAITRSYSAQSSCSPPAAAKISRSSRRRSSWSTPASGSSGPHSSTVPSTVIHAHPARHEQGRRGGRSQQCPSLRVPPRATNAATRRSLHRMGHHARVDHRRLERCRRGGRSTPTPARGRAATSVRTSSSDATSRSVGACSGGRASGSAVRPELVGRAVAGPGEGERPRAARAGRRVGGAHDLEQQPAEDRRRPRGAAGGDVGGQGRRAGRGSPGGGAGRSASPAAAGAAAAGARRSAPPTARARARAAPRWWRWRPGRPRPGPAARHVARTSARRPVSNARVTLASSSTSTASTGAPASASTPATRAGAAISSASASAWMPRSNRAPPPHDGVEPVGARTRAALRRSAPRGA